ncbi:MAG: multidrug ABC transporter permease [Gemmatimonadetes bacterium]|nr:MAG: multidrug ABC transporter permease [Gemmatimonadota bacterium]
MSSRTGGRVRAPRLPSALGAFVRKELHHIVRDRQTLAILLLMPLVQVLLFGYALRTDVRDLRVAMVDPTPDVLTVRLRNRLESTPRFRVVSTATSTALLEDQFQRRVADVALVLPTSFADGLARGDRTPVLLVTDASDPNSGTTMQSYVRAALADFESDLSAPGRGPVRIQVASRMRYNPTLESANLFVPGLIALVLTLVSALMTAISLSREKEQGTLEVLLVSPLRPWQIIVGKVLPYLALGFAITCLVLLAARVVFAVPLRGSLTLLLAESVLYTIVSLSLGVLVAARTTSQRAAMLGALVGTMMPTALLSGMIFPISSMPGWLRPITNVVPARWFIVIARGIMLKGAGLGILWHETLVLAGMALLLLVAATRSFHARLD